MRNAYDCHLSPFDLNLNTASTLAYVDQHGPISQTAIADGLGHGRAATGTYIDRLEHRGLVERLADSDDRRVWLVAATDKGRRLMVDVAEIDKRLRNQLRRGIDHAERQVLADILLRLKDNLDKTAAADEDADDGG
ncbi:MAG: MarR family transcriptional regulator [Acidimicrobiia bacterium]|nr:MarR family transcriptional regulator [Acidimicrobiia bacterium]MDH5521242.1 MarR family transcriptional regulator [Acidimicrobiia bacterium]